MAEKYVVTLSDEERNQLTDITTKGKAGARKIKRANILRLTDSGKTDTEIASLLQTPVSTVHRTRQRFVEEGLSAALSEKARPGRPRSLDGKQEAFLIALACTDAPDGRKRWTVRLLADHLVELSVCEAISRETVRRALKKNETKPWQRKQWCFSRIGADFVWRMEDVLDLYAEPFNPLSPVICFDETPYQLIGETRIPQPAAPGMPVRYDYEYQRNGTCNLFIFFQPLTGWRYVKITPQRTNLHFAQAMKELVSLHCPGATVIRVVLDNLSTHSPAALYQAFPPSEARRILSKLEFHYTPNHASWLNRVEIEISVMKEQCLDRRIPDTEMLQREVQAWQNRRNQAKATVNWRFNCEHARQKLNRLYPQLPVTTSPYFSVQE